MKKQAYFLLIAVFVCLSMVVTADPPPPPGDPSTGGGGSGGPVGAPIDGGLGILLAMGVAYGGRKYFQARKSKKKEGEEAKATEIPYEVL